MPFTHYHIRRLKTSTLRHNQLIGLVSDSLAILDKLQASFTEDRVLFDRGQLLREVLDQYNHTQNRVRKSTIVSELDAADKKRDQAFLLLVHFVRAYTRVSTPDVQTAAQSLQALLKTYSPIVQQSYEAETVALLRLLKQLDNAPYQETVSKLNLAPYIEELRQAQKEFEILYQSRLEEQNQKGETGLALKLRPQVLRHYHFIVDYTAIMAEAHPDKAIYKELLSQLNTVRMQVKSPKKPLASKKEAIDNHLEPA